jgi:hypothetical protein
MRRRQSTEQPQAEGCGTHQAKSLILQARGEELQSGPDFESPAARAENSRAMDGGDAECSCVVIWVALGKSSMAPSDQSVRGVSMKVEIGIYPMRVLPLRYAVSRNHSAIN